MTLPNRSPYLRRLLIPWTCGCLLLAGPTPLRARTPWTTGRVTGSPEPAAPYAVTRRWPAVSWKQPVDLAFAPGTTRLFVVTLGAQVWSFDTAGTGSTPALAIDLRAHHRPLDNVLGFAFHPGFATNRFVFINYNEPGNRPEGSFVSRFTVSMDGTPVIDPRSERVILRWASGGHNGCGLDFGRDGMLYISTGDGGDPDPPDGRARTGQDISDLMSSVLRIDVDHPGGTNHYAIPADNPFVDLAGARPEVWAFGFRNAFRLHANRETGDLWVGDVGWEQWEMIHRVKRGGNYGWSLTEGPNQHVRSDIKPGPGPILPPLVALPHTEAASITGGVIHRGRRLPELNGAYVYGDWETGRFWALRHRGDELVSNRELCDTALKPIAFTCGPDGEVLILDYNGGLYEFVPHPARDANAEFPRRLSDTGLFTSLKPLTPAPGVEPYRINAPMWNDHATAEWFLAIPGTGAIATSGGVGNITGGTWSFPTNTVLARTLTLEFTTGQPASARRIETQLLHWDGQAWMPYTYRWRDDDREADLVGAAGTNALLEVTDSSAPGGRRPTAWRFASRTECLRCHNAWAGEAITLDWLQLGGRTTAPGGGKPAEIDRLARLGLVKFQNVPSPRPAPLVNPAATNAPLTARARSWLHANCSTCHRFGAGGGVALHLRFDQSLDSCRAVDQIPSRGGFGLPLPSLVTPGDPYRSVLYYRIATEGPGHMPHLGAHQVDRAGLALLREWITALPGRPPTNGAESVALELGRKLDRRVAELTGPEATNAVADLMSQTGGALRLMDWLLNHPDRAGVGSNVVVWSSSATNPLARALIDPWRDPADRRALLGPDPTTGTILALPGNARRGQSVFAAESAQCARCHRFGDSGRAFGPDLTGIGRRLTRPQVLDQILFPSRQVAPEFRTHTLELANGREITGFVVERTATEVVVREESLTDTRVPVHAIRSDRISDLSPMPEGLLGALTAQEAADLLEFLVNPPSR